MSGECFCLQCCGWDSTESTGMLEQMESGLDIGPDEVRLYPVQMISSFHQTNQGEMNLGYERVFVQRPIGGTFIEPLDETPPPPSNPASDRDSDFRFPDEEERLQTFSGCWSDVYPVDPVSLAKNGFIFIGPGDLVKCVFCLNTLRDWETGDVVEEEHRRHYPDCPFLIKRCDNFPIQL
ncbi:baculoviral IAP repeat-containing protein 3-like [Physella acuta]|uniref:baculoviral IAP repeat-containing protein 3-like n=1 Tax=Physella acuta TaxID=109671 RepID=UPI0027DAC8F4|nr:baculoviral IAP repeat-containing protein 3-like [Physella acuta]